MCSSVCGSAGAHTQTKMIGTDLVARAIRFIETHIR